MEVQLVDTDDVKTGRTQNISEIGDMKKEYWKIKIDAAKLEREYWNKMLDIANRKS